MSIADRSVCGTIFNIQKFSVNDGPGIRTVVFFKGCPLHCMWCSNPESQSSGLQIMWDRKKCIGCRHCADICPERAVILKDGHIHIEHETCTGCGVCVQSCPGRALTTEGKKISVDEVMRIVLQDRLFYEDSGGGITLSGGEFLCQMSFAENLLLAAKEEGLNTCCETTGYCDSNSFACIIEHFDYVLFDIKHWDSAMHRKGTGAGNERILDNLRIAHSIGKNILPRIPVIPHFNDSLSDAEGFCTVLKSVGIMNCQLLPFHQFGENKYDLLDRDYKYKNIDALHKEDLEDYMNVFVKNGINAFI